MNSHFAFLIILSIIITGCSSSKKIDVVSEYGSLEKTKTERSPFLREATFYGLQKDQFPKDLAAKLLEDRELWVVKCPICDHVKKGFGMYTNGDFKAKKAGSSVQHIKGFSSDDLDDRKIALRNLIDRYVQQYFEVLSMTKDEKLAMQSLLEAGRKDGMNVANGGEGFFCSSCDGACHIKE